MKEGHWIEIVSAWLTQEVAELSCRDGLSLKILLYSGRETRSRLTVQDL